MVFRGFARELSGFLTTLLSKKEFKWKIPAAYGNGWDSSKTGICL
jgi:hypothetical protein